MSSDFIVVSSWWEDDSFPNRVADLFVLIVVAFTVFDLSIITNHDVQALWNSPEAFKSYFENKYEWRTRLIVAWLPSAMWPQPSMRLWISCLPSRPFPCVYRSRLRWWSCCQRRWWRWHRWSALSLRPWVIRSWNEASYGSRTLRKSSRINPQPCSFITVKSCFLSTRALWYVCPILPDALAMLEGTTFKWVQLQRRSASNARCLISSYKWCIDASSVLVFETPSELLSRVDSVHLHPVVIAHSVYSQRVSQFASSSHQPSISSVHEAHFFSYFLYNESPLVCRPCVFSFVFYVVMPYRLLNEVNEIILHNNTSSFYSSIAGSFFYLTGHTMRGMAMSLVNRPFSQTEATTEDGKRDTQMIIDQSFHWNWIWCTGIEAMKSRFFSVIVEQTDLLSLLFECISHILKSSYQYIPTWLWQVDNPFSPRFPFWSSWFLSVQACYSASFWSSCYPDSCSCISLRRVIDV